MINMSYCRWENTYHSFRECADSIADGETLSEREQKYAQRLLSNMIDILLDYGIIDDCPNNVDKRIKDFVEDMADDEHGEEVC